MYMRETGQGVPFQKNKVCWLRCHDAMSRTSAYVHACPHTLQPWLNNEDDVSFSLILDLPTSL